MYAQRPERGRLINLSPCPSPPIIPPSVSHTLTQSAISLSMYVSYLGGQIGILDLDPGAEKPYFSFKQTQGTWERKKKKIVRRLL